jgi:hypothetical protein
MGARLGFGSPDQMSGRKKVPVPPQMTEPEFGWTVQGSILVQQFQLLIFREIKS